MSTSRRLAFLILLPTALAASACSATAEGGGTPSTSASAQPLTLDNCGTEVSFIEPPQQVISVKSTSTEMLLALGLEERIVGTASADGPIPDKWADGAPPVLTKELPSQEAVLAAAPDMVYAGWESNFSASSVGERESLQQLGINTYVSPSACKGAEYKPNPLTFNHVFEEIEQVGDIFGVEDAAQELASAQQQDLADIQPDKAGLTALWYSSGSSTPYVGAGIGAPQMIMEAAGLKNIAADVEDTWSSLSWEVVAERNPDVIVLIDSNWGSVEKKIGVLESDPVTAKLEAVEKERYLILPFAASEAGVRNVSAVSSLVEQLKTLNDVD